MSSIIGEIFIKLIMIFTFGLVVDDNKRDFSLIYLIGA